MNCNLVLSGGGVRGYAHIGVIQALNEKGVTIRAISGTSSGALVGAFICDGFHPEEIKEILMKKSPKVSLNLLRLNESFLSFHSFTETLKRYLRSKRFEDLKLPLYVSATDFNNGSQRIFSEGNILDALIASAAIPVLFPSVTINGVPYVDGGLSSNLPVEPFEGSNEKIIGVNVNPVGDYKEHPGALQNIDRSMHIILRNSIKSNIDKCDVFIEPPGLAQYSVLEHGKIPEIIKTGYDHVMGETEFKIK